MQELAILKHFLMSRGTQYKYHQSIKKIDNLQKEYKMLYDRIDDIYQLFPEMDSIQPDEIKAYLAYKMPSYRNLEFLTELVDLAMETQVGPEITELQLQQLAERHIAGKIVACLAPVLEGVKFEQIPKAMELVQEYEDLAGSLTADDALQPCTDTIEALVEQKVSKTGLTFPITKLQNAIGDAEYGTSGLIFARPETGKTSLGLTLAAHWSECMKNDPDWLGLYFGVEERITKHRMRFHQSLLGCKEVHLIAKPAVAEAEAIKRGRDKFMFFGSVANTRHIEQLTKRYNPKCIIIDQTPKIYMPGQPDSEVQRLAKIFLWVRQFAKAQDILAVNLMQAAASAENKQWLSQTDMHNSKTDVAGETDWACGVGVVNEPGMEFTRFLSLCRNKNGPHVRAQTYFDAERCRYYDTAPTPKGKP
jgi:replicative DNA helicase